ncbi:aminoacetone oxidase family FAD-binding enzyme [Peptoniphilus sp. KCTC 25270]|uniref:NAD(P)/FAD-dependent oxidoreductase n=1 Tax=Peptoniphilus sp. KCTC 25270 TaxID=2897414 RepID=UPI001E42B48B|nr:aminoacetone oxidase family FAD-binding enzyme [Peptoniphilus sp. KCTC 25270]MCD1146564.1 aminoacetone oxidase family FAD-binding enzyme [Peptoniphilus sp. KCTC 25270]
MKIGIIGGGASGLACGIFLAREGHEVKILERGDRVGKKLLATGNGRCNVSNVDLSSHHFHSVEGEVFSSILEEFTGEDTKEFFESLGMDLVEEARGKLYPITLNSNTVLNAFREELSRLGVEEITQWKVREIQKEKKGFRLIGQGELFVDRVILATGGKTMAKSGSDGNGYGLLETFGHKKSKLFPGICAVQLDSPHLRHLSGTKVVGEIELYNGKKKIFSSHGEILLAKDGISGPPVLDLARYVNCGRGDLFVKFPLLNHLDQRPSNYREILESRTYLDRSLESFLQGIVSKKWIHVICKELNLSPESSVMDLEYEQRQTVLDLLFGMEMKVLGTRDFESAQVTCGGLRLEDFDEKTLESKRVPGIFAIGEVLDVDGDCGGYNLQWAWASAWACARGMEKN